MKTGEMVAIIEGQRIVSVRLEGDGTTGLSAESLQIDSLILENGIELGISEPVSIFQKIRGNTEELVELDPS